MAMRKPVATPRSRKGPAPDTRERKGPAADAVVKALAEFEKKPRGSEQRFQAFRKVLKAVHDEHAE